MNFDQYKILDGYRNEDGKFTQFPGKRQKKKVELMLSFLAEKFESNKTYTEKEVNNILNAHHTFNDPAILRRLMFGAKILNRTLDGRKYWLVESSH